jgi:hypothetical protein
MIFGVAISDRNRLLIAVGNVFPMERKAGGVEMIEAQVNTFLGTDRQSQLMKQEVAAVGVGLVKRAAKLKTVKHLGTHATSQQQLERFVGKKLRGQGQRPVGKPKPIQNHPRHGFARREDFLGIWHEPCVDHLNQL